MAKSNPGVATLPSPPETADVVVIGAGISGLSTAFQLVRRRAGKVVVLERKHIGAGASGKSGALVRAHYANVPESTLTFESLKIFRNWGEEVGQRWSGAQLNATESGLKIHRNMHNVN